MIAPPTVRSLFRELRRRRVFRVGAVYAAVAWALIEGANTVLPRLAVPDWSITLVIVMALFGLPLALVLAWAYDVTPDGIRRADDPPNEASSAGRRASTAVLVAVLVISLGAGLTIRGMRATPASGTDNGFRSIAVLPFENAGAGGSEEYLSEGIAEELLHRLSRVPELRVAARTSSFAFRQGEVDVRDIGTRLNVDVILEGSVLSVGDKLRVRASLVSTRDGFQLWSESYEPELTDIFRVPEEISAAIIARMLPDEERATPADSDRTASPSGAAANSAAEPENYEAFELYMRGRYEWNRRTEEGLRSAARYFEQAIVHSPRYARAHLGLADALAVLAFYDYVPPAHGFSQARQAAARALELDPSLFEAHATLAYVALYHDYDFDAAGRGFHRAIELNPRYAVAHQWYANLLIAQGRSEDAHREMRQAQQLDPLALIGHAADGFVSIMAREYDRAVRQLATVLESDSTYFLALVWQGIALELSGRTAEAVAVLQRAVRLSPHSVLGESALARALALAGRPADARRMLGALEARGEREYVGSYDLALAYIALGDTAAALDRLERAAADRSHAMAFLDVDPRLDAVRGSARFERVRASIRPRG